MNTKNPSTCRYFLFFIILFATCAAQSQTVKTDSLIIKPDSTITKMFKTDSLPTDSLSQPSKLKEQKKLPEPQILESDTSKRVQGWKRGFLLSGNDIHRLIYRNFGDIVIYVPGFYTYNRGIPGQETFSSVHGLRSNQFSIFLDGRPMKDPHTNSLDLNMIPGENIESILYGYDLSSSLFFNPLTVKSERFSGATPYTRVYFHKGPGDFSDTDVLFGQQVSLKTDATVGLAIKGFNGPLAAQSYEHHQGRININHRYSPRWRLLYSFLYNRVKSHTVGPKLALYEYATERARLKQIRYDHTIGLKGGLFHSYYENFSLNLYYSSIKKDWEDRDREDEIFWNSDYHYIGILSELKQQIRSLLFTFEGNSEYYWINDFSIGKKNRTMLALGARAEWFMNRLIKISGKTSLSSSKNGTQLASGVGVGFMPFKSFQSNVEMSLSIMNPTLYDLYYSDNYFTGNKDLKSEIINKINVHVNYQPDSTLQFHSNVYLQTIDNMIGFAAVNDSLTTLKNLSVQNLFGYDIGGKIFLFNHYGLGGQVNFVNIDDELFSEVPAVTVYSYVQYKNVFFQNDLGLDLRFEARYWGEHYSNTSLPYEFRPMYTILPENWILSVTGYFKLLKNVQMYMSYENLLNTEYQLVYGYPMNNKTVHYGLRWEFWE